MPITMTTPVRFDSTIYLSATEASEWFTIPGLSPSLLQKLRSRGEGPQAYKLVDGLWEPFEKFPTSTHTVYYKLNDLFKFVRTNAVANIETQQNIIAAAEEAVERAIEFVNAPDGDELKEVACENCGDKFYTDSEYHWCSVECAEPYLNSSFFELENGFGSELPKFKGYTLSTCSSCGHPQYVTDGSDDVCDEYCDRCMKLAYSG